MRCGVRSVHTKRSDLAAGLGLFMSGKLYADALAFGLQPGDFARVPLRITRYDPRWWGPRSCPEALIHHDWEEWCEVVGLEAAGLTVKRVGTKLLLTATWHYRCGPQDFRRAGDKRG